MTETEYKNEKDDLIETIGTNILAALRNKGWYVGPILECEIKGNLGALVELARQKGA